MPSDSIESLFSRRHIQRYGDLREAGIHHRPLMRAIDEGLVVRPVIKASLGPVPTIYVSPELDADPMRDDIIASFMVNGVIGRRTAAFRQNLNTGMPRTIEMWVSHKSTSRVVPELNVDIMRARNEAKLAVGIVTHDNEYGVPVRMTSPARTVVDLFEAGRDDADDYRMALQAISTFLSHGGEPGEVLSVARGLGQDMDERLELALNAAFEGMTSGGMEP